MGPPRRSAWWFRCHVEASWALGRGRGVRKPLRAGYAEGEQAIDGDGGTKARTEISGESCRFGLLHFKCAS